MKRDKSSSQACLRGNFLRGWPALLTLLVSLVFILLRLESYAFDPAALAEPGTRFSQLDPGGSEGYDGQFTLYIAQDLIPRSVSSHLDVPAYRYQRILLSLLAFLLSAGNRVLIPWMLLVINITAHTAAVLGLAELLHRAGHARRYALIYGLWAGVVLTIAADLHEALAYGLVILGWSSWRRGEWTGPVFLTLAMFAKETSLLFWFAALLEEILPLLSRRPRKHATLRQIMRIPSTSLLLAGGLLFALWQAWLWLIFGRPGLGSGGAVATGFEWLPFGGLVKLAPYGSYFAGVLAIATPIVLLALWGVYELFQSLLRKELSAEAAALALNSALMIFLPFSSYREPWAVVRLAAGLVLAAVLHAAVAGNRRVLNYAMFLIVYLVILVKML